MRVLKRDSFSDIGWVPEKTAERGMALIGVMLIMSLMLMLALAVTFTALTDNNITSNFKNTTSGFYAAEAGINNMHRLIRSSDFTLKALPNPPKVTPGQPTIVPEQFIPAFESLLSTREYFPNNSAYRTKLKVTDFKMPYPADDLNPAHSRNRITYVNSANPRFGQLETYSISYELNSVGEGIAGLNGTVTLVEEGVINFKLLATANAGGLRAGSFSEFALYLDHFDPYHPEAGFIYQGLGPGDRFSGRVHTNERLGFWTGADGRDPPVFRGRVTQAYHDASYYRHNGGAPPPPTDGESQVVGGVLVAPEFLAGFERGVPAIPPPSSAFNQARAVLDGGFGLSAEPPSVEELRHALRAADSLSVPLDRPPDEGGPPGRGGKGKEADDSEPTGLPDGVYIPSDGESFTGSGIYVAGTADEIELGADPSGNRQVIKITQGKQTVTVVVDIDAGTTTIDAGNGTRTLRGIPTDRSLLGRGGRAAASLYVNGSIKSLHGPGRSGDDQPIPAIDTEFALTVTAEADPNRPAGKKDGITITGDLVYETPVTGPSGEPINSNATNVLGIFASGYDINIPVDGTAPSGLMVNASMAAFHLRDNAGNPILGPSGQPIGGHIQSDLSNWRSTPHRGNFTLVGGMQSSVYGNFAVYDGRTHGYTYKGVWDPRYDQSLAPPFYPGYFVETGEPGGMSQVKTQAHSPVVLSYRRAYYGTLPAK